MRIEVFKSIRVLARGELRNPGFYKFPSYRSVSSINNDENNNEELEISRSSKLNNQASQNIVVKRSSGNLTTISDIIMKAGGITSLTDLSQIEIIRDVPMEKVEVKRERLLI